MTRVLKHGVAGLILAAAGLASAVPAQAAVILSVGNTIINDNGAGDSNPATGVISYFGAVSGYEVSVQTGIGTSLPFLDLGSQLTNSSSTAPLVIRLTQTNLTSPTGIQNYFSQFTGSWTGGSATVTDQTYIDTSNTAFGTGTLLANLSASSTPFALSNTGSGGGATPFSVTEVVTVTPGGAGRSFSLDAQLTRVPEPASLGLLGAGLVGLGMIRRRFSRA